MHACLLHFQEGIITVPPPLLCVIVQVKTLQLERDQGQMLLENVQHRHKQDMELMDNTHK